MAEKSFYDILGVSNDASQDDIKSAYKKLAKKWHPDRFSNKSEEERKDAEEKFKEISEAYNTLSDPNKRREYDMGETGGFNPFEDFVDPFGMFSHRNENRVPKGESIHTKVELTLKESILGGKKTVYYDSYEICDHCKGTGSENGKVDNCPHCNGTGRLRQESRYGGGVFIQETICPHCYGTGKHIKEKCHVCGGEGCVIKKKSITIDIPKGVFSGVSFKKEGLGVPVHGGVNGDLIIEFSVKPDSRFARKDDNFFTTVTIPLADALLGCEKEVVCPDESKVKIKIPELCESGQMLSIKGKGAPNLASGGSFVGDLIVVVKYQLPSKLTEKQKKLIKEFSNG